MLGISAEEQKALWLILGAIYHLGAAGATKGNTHSHTHRLTPNIVEKPVLSTVYCILVGRD